jgi:hypothetical protein
MGFEGSGTIAYRVADNTDDVEIIGVFYGAWDWEEQIMKSNPTPKATAQTEVS